MSNLQHWDSVIKSLRCDQIPDRFIRNLIVTTQDKEYRCATMPQYQKLMLALANKGHFVQAVDIDIKVRLIKKEVQDNLRPLFLNVFGKK